MIRAVGLGLLLGWLVLKSLGEQARGRTVD
jgi:hypothetical protein